MRRNRTMWFVGAVVAAGLVQACAVRSDEGDEQTAPLVGDGILDPGEQCDDGNTTNLDGCSAAGKFEQIYRVSGAQWQFAGTPFCSANAIGGAFSSILHGQVQGLLDDTFKSGADSMLMQAEVVDATHHKLGLFIGDPVQAAGYDSAHDLDWWYTAQPTSIDANARPLASFNGAVNGASVTAGPTSVPLSILGFATNAVLSNVKMKVALGATSAPTKSTNGSTPGHLASEHVDPSLKTTAAVAGEMCADVSAATLASMPVPAAIMSGTIHCSENYTTSNSLLDLFVGGCKVLIVKAFAATQPDQTDPNAPVAGAGGAYKLTAGADHKVTSCTDKNGRTVDLATCLRAATYSASFKFGGGRVIAKH